MNSPILQRTALSVPFVEFLQDLERTHPSVGKVHSSEPIEEGYEAANFLLTTDTGRYVLKIFESDRNPQNIQDLIKIHIEAPKVGVPMPVLVKGNEGFLSHFPQEGLKIPYYLTEYFDGKSFEYSAPTLDDMRKVTRYIAQLNSLSFPIFEAYDSWGNKNLVHEFEKNTAKLSNEVVSAVEDVVEELRILNLQSLPKGVIHGDMQRKHVFHSGSNFCIIDFGCMSYDARVIDLSTFLAWFCFSGENWDERDAILSVILEVYQEKSQLSDEEKHTLPPLIRAAYAAYFMKTSLLIQEGDTSEQTKTWNTSSGELLQLSKNTTFSALE